MDEADAEPGALERRAADLVRAAEDAVAADDERRRDAVRTELERIRRALDDAFSVLDAERDRRVSDVFEKLRAAPPPPPAPTRAPAPAAEPAEPEPAAAAVPAAEPSEPQPAAAPEPAAPDPAAKADDAVRARRDAVVTPLIPDLFRAAKRLLQDEQNLLLDAVRRAKARIEPSRLLPEPVRHREIWATTIAPAVDVAYGSGRTSAGRRRKAAGAPERVVNELAAAAVAPLRERLTTTIQGVVVADAGVSPVPELTRALASAIGARYREWKQRDLEVVLLDVLSAAYARGAYDAAPGGARLRWVPDRPGQCPDCDDDALEVTVKSKLFPTGQAFPPAHPGCRCIVVPADDEPDRGASATDR